MNVNHSCIRVCPLAKFLLTNSEHRYLHDYRFTNPDGRCPGLLTQEKFLPATYKINFDTSAYFKENNTTGFYPYVDVSSVSGSEIINAFRCPTNFLLVVQTFGSLNCWQHKLLAVHFWKHQLLAMQILAAQTFGSTYFCERSTNFGQGNKHLVAQILGSATFWQCKRLVAQT